MVVGVDDVSNEPNRLFVPTSVRYFEINRRNQSVLFPSLYHQQNTYGLSTKWIALETCPISMIDRLRFFRDLFWNWFFCFWRHKYFYHLSSTGAPSTQSQLTKKNNFFQHTFSLRSVAIGADPFPPISKHYFQFLNDWKLSSLSINSDDLFRSAHPKYPENVLFRQRSVDNWT